MQGAVLNPYDLHARSEAASAALLLAPAVVTLRPAPLEGTGADALRAAAEDAPAFGELVRAWAWSGPLWRGGVLRGTWDGEEPIEDVQRAAREIAGGGGPLAEVVGASPFEDTRAYLQAMCQDLMRGGRDPGVAVPVAVGLESFAGRHGLAIVRGQGKSLAAKFEAKAARALAQVTTAIVVGADAEEMLELRAQAQVELEALWAAIEEPGAGGLDDAGDALSRAVQGWLGGAGKGVRGVAVRLSVARMEAGTVKASAMSALGAKAAGGLPEAAALARAGARVITVRTLPWSLESR